MFGSFGIIPYLYINKLINKPLKILIMRTLFTFFIALFIVQFAFGQTSQTRSFYNQVPLEVDSGLFIDLENCVVIPHNSSRMMIEQTVAITASVNSKDYNTQTFERLGSLCSNLVEYDGTTLTENTQSLLLISNNNRVSIETNYVVKVPQPIFEMLFPTE